jgi:hypothetical protein
VPSIPNLRRPGRKAGDHSVAGDASEFKDLLLAYVRQETLDPLKTLGRFLLWGAVGAVLMSVGGVFLALGIVRAIQTEAGVHLSGHLTWVPYMGGLLFALIVAGLAASRITKAPR